MGSLLAVNHTSRSEVNPSEFNLPPSSPPPGKAAQRNKTAQRSNAALGILAETMVAQWLIQQGWQIVARRWHCRWGELDLVAQSPAGSHATLIFVEVKARSRFNWDEGGLLAITPQKQAKLWQAAELFLTEHSWLAEFSCRFDVALVAGQRLPHLLPDLKQTNLETLIPTIEIPAIELGSPIVLAGYQLTLQHYLESAFEN